MEIKCAFQNELQELDIALLVPTKELHNTVKNGKKYKQILSSIKEVGLIEPPAVAISPNDGNYMILDGHFRIMALKEIGEKTVQCLLANDDEAYTYNKYVCSLTPIQENRMILHVLDEGTPEDKTSRSLGVNIDTLRGKANLLAGICPEVVDMLKEKSISARALNYLAKMQAPRQIKVAMLMKAQNNYTKKFVRAQYDETDDSMLKEKRRQKFDPIADAQRAMLEVEQQELDRKIEEIRDEYNNVILDMVALQSYLRHLLDNPLVANFLKEYQPALFEKFTEIATYNALGRTG